MDEGGDPEAICTPCWGTVTRNGRRDVPREWLWTSEGGPEWPPETGDGITAAPEDFGKPWKGTTRPGAIAAREEAREQRRRALRALGIKPRRRN